MSLFVPQAVLEELVGEVPLEPVRELLQQVQVLEPVRGQVLEEQ
jgi:hypothetical protein